MSEEDVSEPADDSSTTDAGQVADENEQSVSAEDEEIPDEDEQSVFPEEETPDEDDQVPDEGEKSGPEPGTELVERVEDAPPEQVAREIAALRDRIESLEEELDAKAEEVDDLESRLKRKQADFQNYKKRMERKREEEQKRATEDLVERLLDVRDNLQRALDAEEDADIRGGVETTLRQFDRVLDGENVERVDPRPGESVDPERHEVLMRVESDEEPGTVDEVHRPGYEMAGKVLRPAQVTVADESDE